MRPSNKVRRGDNEDENTRAGGVGVGAADVVHRVASVGLEAVAVASAAERVRHRQVEWVVDQVNCANRDVPLRDVVGCNRRTGDRPCDVSVGVVLVADRIPGVIVVVNHRRFIWSGSEGQSPGDGSDHSVDDGGRVELAAVLWANKGTVNGWTVQAKQRVFLVVVTRLTSLFLRTSQAAQSQDHDSKC